MESNEGVKRDTFWKSVDDLSLVEGPESKPINEASGYVSNTPKFDSIKETVDNKPYPTEGDIEDFLENLKELNSCGTSGFEEVASSKFCSQSNVNNELTLGVGNINVCFINDRNGSKLDNVSNKALVSYKPDGTLVKTIIRNESFIDKTITNQDVSDSSDRLVYVNVNKNEDSTSDFSDDKYNDKPKKCYKSEERKFGRRLEERQKEGRYRERSPRGSRGSKEDQRKDKMNRRGGEFKECRGGEERRRNSRDGRYRSDSRESDRRYRRSPSRERYPYKDRSPQQSRKLSLSPPPLRELNKSPLKLDREVDPMTRRFSEDLSKIGFPPALPTNPFLRPIQPQYTSSGLNIGFPPMNISYQNQAIGGTGSRLLRPATFTAPLTGGMPSFSGPGAGGSGGGGVSSYPSTKPGNTSSVGMETKLSVVQQEAMWRQQAPGASERNQWSDRDGGGPTRVDQQQNQAAGQWSDRGGSGPTRNDPKPGTTGQWSDRGGSYGGPSRGDQQQKLAAGSQWSDRGGGGSLGGSTRGDQQSVGRDQWTDRGGGGPTTSDPKSIAGSQWTDRGDPSRNDPKPPGGSQWTDRGGPTRNDPKPPGGSQWSDRGGPTRKDPKATGGSQWTDRGGPTRSDSKPTAGSQWSERGGVGPTRSDPKLTVGSQWSERGGGGPTRGDQKPTAGGQWSERGGGGPTRGDPKPTVGGQWSERGSGGSARGDQKAAIGGQWSERGGVGPTRGEQKPTIGGQWSDRGGGGLIKDDQKVTIGGQWSDPDRGDQKQSATGLGGGSTRTDTDVAGGQWSDRGGLGGSNRGNQGRSSPYPQYSDYRSAAPLPPTLKRNLDSFSSQPMSDRSNEILKKPKLVIDPNRIPTPPPPPILGKYCSAGSSAKSWENKSSSADQRAPVVAGLSLSCLLETVMEHTGQGKSQVSDPKVKTSILSECEAKINQLYRRRISGLGAFVPNKVTKRTNFVNESPLVTHHPQISFNSNSIKEIWHCPGIVIPSVQVEKPPEIPLNIEELSTKMNFDMKYKIPGDNRNNNNISSISDSILGTMNPQEVTGSLESNVPSSIPSTYDSVASSVQLDYGDNILNDTPKTMNWNAPSYPQPHMQPNYNASGFPYGGPLPGYPAAGPPVNPVMYPNQQRNMTVYPTQQQMLQQFQNPPNYAYQTTYPLQQYSSPTSYPLQDRFANKPNMNFANMGPNKNVRYPLGNEDWKHSRIEVNSNISQVTMSDMVQTNALRVKSSHLHIESDDKQRSSRSKDHRRRSLSKERSFRRSPEKKRRRTPERRKKSRTPDRRRRSRTPDRFRRSRTPDRFRRSRTPDRLRRSRSFDKRRKSRSPDERFKKDLLKVIPEKRKEETDMVDPKDKLLQKMWNPGDFNVGDKETKSVQKVAGDKPKEKGNAVIGGPAGDLDMRNALLMFDGNKPTFITAESQLKKNEKPPINNQVIEIDSDETLSDSEKSQSKIISKNIITSKKEEDAESESSGRIGLEDILTMGPQIRFMQEKSTLYRAIIQSLVKGDKVYKRLYAFKNKCLCRLLEGKISEIVVPRESVKEFISLLHKNFHNIFFKELRRAIGEYCYPSLFQSASYNVSRVLSECPECIKDNNTPSSLRLIDEKKQEKMKLPSKDRRIDKSPFRERNMFEAESPRRDRRMKRSRSSERGRFGRISDFEKNSTYRDDYRRGEEPPGYERALKVRPPSLEPFGPELNNQSSMHNYLGNEMDDIDGVPIDDIEEIEVFGNVEEAGSVAKDDADFIVLSEVEDEFETSKKPKGGKRIAKSPTNEKFKFVPLKEDTIGKVEIRCSEQTREDKPCSVSSELGKDLTSSSKNLNIMDYKPGVAATPHLVVENFWKKPVKVDVEIKTSTTTFSDPVKSDAVTKKDTTSEKTEVTTNTMLQKNMTAASSGNTNQTSDAATKKGMPSIIPEKANVKTDAISKKHTTSEIVEVKGTATSGKSAVKAVATTKDTTSITPGKSNAKTNVAAKKDTSPSISEASGVNAVAATKKDTTSGKLDVKSDTVTKKDTTSITPGKSNAKTNVAAKKDTSPSISETSGVNAVAAIKKDNTSGKLDVKSDTVTKKDTTSTTPGKSNAATKKDTTPSISETSDVNVVAATKKDTISGKLEMNAVASPQKDTTSITPGKSNANTNSAAKKDTTPSISENVVAAIKKDTISGKLDVKADNAIQKDTMSSGKDVGTAKKETISGKSDIMTDAATKKDAIAGKIDIKTNVESKKDSRAGKLDVAAVAVTKKDNTLPISSGKSEVDKTPAPQEKPKDDKEVSTKPRAPGGQKKEQTSPSDFKGKIRQVQESSSLLVEVLERLNAGAEPRILTQDNECYSLKGQGKSQVSDPKVKTSLITNCEGKISELDGRKVSGLGAFVASRSKPDEVAEKVGFVEESPETVYPPQVESACSGGGEVNVRPPAVGNSSETSNESTTSTYFEKTGKILGIGSQSLEEGNSQTKKQKIHSYVASAKAFQPSIPSVNAFPAGVPSTKAFLPNVLSTSACPPKVSSAYASASIPVKPTETIPTTWTPNHPPPGYSFTVPPPGFVAAEIDAVKYPDKQRNLITYPLPQSLMQRPPPIVHPEQQFPCVPKFPYSTSYPLKYTQLQTTQQFEGTVTLCEIKQKEEEKPKDLRSDQQRSLSKDRLLGNYSIRRSSDRKRSFSPDRRRKSRSTDRPRNHRRPASQRNSRSPNRSRKLCSPSRSRKLCSPSRSRNLHNPNKSRKLTSPGRRRNFRTPDKSRKLTGPGRSRKSRSPEKVRKDTPHRSSVHLTQDQQQRNEDLGDDEDEDKRDISKAVIDPKERFRRKMWNLRRIKDQKGKEEECVDSMEGKFSKPNNQKSAVTASKDADASKNEENIVSDSTKLTCLDVILDIGSQIRSIQEKSIVFKGIIESLKTDYELYKKTYFIRNNCLCRMAAGEIVIPDKNAKEFITLLHKRFHNVSFHDLRRGVEEFVYPPVDCVESYIYTVVRECDKCFKDKKHLSLRKPLERMQARTSKLANRGRDGPFTGKKSCKGKNPVRERSKSPWRNSQYGERGGCRRGEDIPEDNRAVIAEPTSEELGKESNNLEKDVDNNENELAVVSRMEEGEQSEEAATEGGRSILSRKLEKSKEEEVIDRELIEFDTVKVITEDEEVEVQHETPIVQDETKLTAALGPSTVKGKPFQEDERSVNYDQMKITEDKTTIEKSNLTKDVLMDSAANNTTSTSQQKKESYLSKEHSSILEQDKPISPTELTVKISSEISGGEQEGVDSVVTNDSLASRSVNIEANLQVSEIIEVDSDTSMEKNSIIEEIVVIDISELKCLKDILVVGPQMRIIQEKSSVYKNIIESIEKGEQIYEKLYVIMNSCLCRKAGGKLSEIVIPRETLTEFIALLHKHFHKVSFRNLLLALDAFFYPPVDRRQFNPNVVTRDCSKCLEDKSKATQPGKVRATTPGEKNRRSSSRERKLKKSLGRGRSRRSGHVKGDSRSGRISKTDYRRDEEPRRQEKAMKVRPTTAAVRKEHENMIGTSKNLEYDIDGWPMDDEEAALSKFQDDENILIICGEPVKIVDEIYDSSNAVDDEDKLVLGDGDEFIVLSEVEDEEAEQKSYLLSGKLELSESLGKELVGKDVESSLISSEERRKPSKTDVEYKPAVASSPPIDKGSSSQKVDNKIVQYNEENKEVLMHYSALGNTNVTKGASTKKNITATSFSGNIGTTTVAATTDTTAVTLEQSGVPTDAASKKDFSRHSHANETAIKTYSKGTRDDISVEGSISVVHTVQSKPCSSGKRSWTSFIGKNDRSDGRSSSNERRLRIDSKRSFDSNRLRPSGLNKKCSLDRLNSRSPARYRNCSPDRFRRRSPNSYRRRSPDSYRKQSTRRGARSPDRCNMRSPGGHATCRLSSGTENVCEKAPNCYERAVRTQIAGTENERQNVVTYHDMEDSRRVKEEEVSLLPSEPNSSNSAEEDDEFVVLSEIEEGQLSD